MSFDDISPNYGEFYDLVKDGTGGMFPGYRKFKGMYIGFNPNTTPWFSKIDFPEGHVFVEFSEDGISVYCQRQDKLKETWLSDGDDDPAYPIGIAVSKLDVKLRESEAKYLNQLFERKKKIRRAA